MCWLLSLIINIQILLIGFIIYIFICIHPKTYTELHYLQDYENFISYNIIIEDNFVSPFRN